MPDTPQAAVRTIGSAPGTRRSREFLEGFRSTLCAWSARLYIGETNYGLVQTADGLIHRVVPGNYMGQNDGRITGISESEIELLKLFLTGSAVTSNETPLLVLQTDA